VPKELRFDTNSHFLIYILKNPIRLHRNPSGDTKFKDSNAGEAIMKIESIIVCALMTLLSSMAYAETMGDLLARLPGKWVEPDNGMAGLTITFSSYHADQPWALITGEVTGQATDPFQLEFLTNRPAGLNNAVYFLRVTNRRLNTVNVYTLSEEFPDKNGNFDFWEYILDSKDSNLTAEGIRLSFVMDDGPHKNALLFGWFGGNGYCTTNGKTEQCDSGRYSPFWIKKVN